MLLKKQIDVWNKLKFGLVLSGGGAKGAYEAGVMRALYELDIADKVRVVSGTSVGALNTLVFAMGDAYLGQEIWENVKFSTIMVKKDREDRAKVRDLVKSLSSEGAVFSELNAHLVEALAGEPSPYTQEGLEALLREKINFGRLRAGRAELYVCAYDIDALHPVYLRINDFSDEEMIKAVLASAAIPYVFDPVEFGGRRYADGGINDPVYVVKNSDVTPIVPLKDYDLDVVIVVHLKQPEGVEVSGLGNARMIHILPSKPLEPVKGAGTLNFIHSSIHEKIVLGYRDGIAALAPLIMEYLRKSE